MKSEHDHWGEMRGLRKKMRRTTSVSERAELWERYRALSWSLDGLLTAKLARIAEERAAEERRLARSTWPARFTDLRRK